MTAPTRLLADRFRAALSGAFAPEYAAIDPVLRPSQFADYQANVALALAKRLGLPPREVAERLVEHLEVDRRVASAEVSGPGFVNLTLLREWLGRAAHRAGRRPAPRGPRAGPADRPDRLLRAQRRQGDARRAPAYDGRRRRAGPHAGAPGPRRHPAEPHRGLGHAVRDAHRAPARRRGGLRRGAGCWPRTRTPSTRRRGASSTPTAGGFADAGPAPGGRRCRPATPRPCGSGSELVDLSKAYFNRIYAVLGVTLTDADLAGESTLQRRPGRHLRRAGGTGHRRPAATARCASSSTATPAGRASRCR